MSREINEVEEQHIIRFLRSNTDYLGPAFGTSYARKVFPYICDILAENNPIYVRFLERIFYSAQVYSDMYQINHARHQEYMRNHLHQVIDGTELVRETVTHQMYDDIRARNVRECFARDPITGERIVDQDTEGNITLRRGIMEDHPQLFLQMYDTFVQNPELPNRWFMDDLALIVDEIHRAGVTLVESNTPDILYYRRFWQYTSYHEIDHEFRASNETHEYQNMEQEPEQEPEPEPEPEPEQHIIELIEIVESNTINNAYEI
jgi:hypothetical protein